MVVAKIFPQSLVERNSLINTPMLECYRFSNACYILELSWGKGSVARRHEDLDAGVY